MKTSLSWKDPREMTMEELINDYLTHSCSTANKQWLQENQDLILETKKEISQNDKMLD